MSLPLEDSIAKVLVYGDEEAKRKLKYFQDQRTFQASKLNNTVKGIENEYALKMKHIREKLEEDFKKKETSWRQHTDHKLNATKSSFLLTMNYYEKEILSLATKVKEFVPTEWWYLLPIINPLTFYFIDSIIQAVK